MRMIDTGYVVKDLNDLYYIGYNQWSDQLRKAKIYHSKRYAQDIMNDTRYINKTLKLVKIKIEEIE